jgi:hypothetical protein
VTSRSSVTFRIFRIGLLGSGSARTNQPPGTRPSLGKRELLERARLPVEGRRERRPAGNDEVVAGHDEVALRGHAAQGLGRVRLIPVEEAAPVVRQTTSPLAASSA